MRFTLSWLKNHLDTDASLEAIADTLTMIGLEVEDIQDKSAALAPFRIAKVLSAEQHPNADRLKVLMVDTGEGSNPVQVVCGATNARAGLVGVFAAPGTYIPGTGIELAVGTIRGVESHGMMCSEREMQISDEHDGIIDLATDTPIGEPYAAWAGLDDPVIEIGITPNRPDCLGIHGIARDLAATGLGQLKDNPHPLIRGDFDPLINVALEFAEQDSLCTAFALRVFRNVKNGPAPKWMQQRLLAIGLRPINTLADITNYITYDLGRPLHVFDADKVKGNLIVRHARAGESIKALDGKTYVLDESMCVIADDNGAQSIAGIIGGEATGCDENTTNVILESALWLPLNIARTGRTLGIHSDARYRFERGVDPAFTVPGLDHASQLILDLADGEPSQSTIAGQFPESDLIIDFPISEIKRLSGIDVDPREVKIVLERLGFWVAGIGSILKVAVPSWRPDIHGKADLVEEIVRIIGLDKIPAICTLGREHVIGKVLTVAQNRSRLTKRMLAARGLIEAVTWSFIAKDEALSFGGGGQSTELANPISSDLSDMRPSLLPGLLKASKRNIDRGIYDIGLFEVGQFFLSDQPEDQKTAATALRFGAFKMNAVGRHWSSSTSSVDVFDAKSDALAIIATCGMAPEKVQVAHDAPHWFHPGRSGVLRLGPNILGYFGELHPTLLEHFEIDSPVVACEIILDAVPMPRKRATCSKPPFVRHDLMPVRRDFAFIIPIASPAEAIIRAARSAEKTLISNISLFDVYQGEHIDADKKSVAIEVTIQPKAKTLTDEDIDGISTKIIAAVEKATGGTLRQ